ncbi:hypothetical protein ABRY23_05985 [Melioribacteraceae bacterium 4301-Me]|uniref:hypothetical protein n=1 Tax=Pyranulibacter aquaticus TaxID=3163344 RepID=UPI003597B7D8
MKNNNFKTRVLGFIVLFIGLWAGYLTSSQYSFAMRPAQCSGNATLCATETIYYLAPDGTLIQVTYYYPWQYLV